jgi:hypothetical protein
MRPSRVGSAIKRCRAPLFAVLAAASGGLLFVLGALVGGRGLAIVVTFGVFMLVVFRLGRGGDADRQGRC